MLVGMHDQRAVSAQSFRHSRSAFRSIRHLAIDYAAECACAIDHVCRPGAMPFDRCRGMTSSMSAWANLML